MCYTKPGQQHLPPTHTLPTNTAVAPTGLVEGAGETGWQWWQWWRHKMTVLLTSATWRAYLMRGWPAHRLLRWWWVHHTMLTCVPLPLVRRSRYAMVCMDANNRQLHTTARPVSVATSTCSALHSLSCHMHWSSSRSKIKCATEKYEKGTAITFFSVQLKTFFSIEDLSVKK